MLTNSHRERLNEETPVVMTGDAIVRPALNRENAEAGRNDQSVSEYRDGNSARISLPHFTSTESISIGTPQFGVASELNRNARISSDGLEPCDGNKAEAGRKLTGHRERLSEETSCIKDDAIVRSYGKQNHKRATEMIAPSLSIERVTIQREFSLGIARGRFGEIQTSKLSLIDSNPETATRAKITKNSNHAERLSEKATYRVDAIVRSHTNNKYERLAEMTNPSDGWRVTNSTICGTEVWWGSCEGGKLRALLMAGSLPLKGGSEKFPLIDSNAEIANEAEGESYRERLSEETSYMDDAIVRSYGNNNHKRLAEMTGPVERRVTRKHLYTVR